jgi:hypothetical protein
MPFVRGFWSSVRVVAEGILGGCVWRKEERKIGREMDFFSFLQCSRAQKAVGLLALIYRKKSRDPITHVNQLKTRTSAIDLGL